MVVKPSTLHAGVLSSIPLWGLSTNSEVAPDAGKGPKEAVGVRKPGTSPGEVRVVGQD